MVEFKNKDLVLGLIILVLLISTVVFWIRSETNASREAEAYEMSAHVVDVLRAQKYSQAYTQCRTISAGRYDLLEECLLVIKQTQNKGMLFEEAGFRKFDERRNTTGYLVIENAKGNEVFLSEEFTLYLNNELIAQGCNTPGEIGPGFTCRFDLIQWCDTGDNLEVKYGDERVHLRNC